METRISYDNFQSVKRVAQACNPFYAKRNKVKAQIEKLAREYKEYDIQIQSLEAGIKQLTGFRVEQLIKKVVELSVREDGTPVLSADGKQVKSTKYVPTDIVSYDKERKQFVITTPDDLCESEQEEAHAETTQAPCEGEEPQNMESVGELTSNTAWD